MKYLLLVPVYNAAHLLPFFFESIRKMNPKPDYIVWAVNNCTDNTVPMLKAFNDVPSEVLELPDFPRDFVKQHGAYEAMAIVRQRLWERARELGYVICLDGVALVEHVLYDSKRLLKPWTFKNNEPIFIENKSRKF